MSLHDLLDSHGGLTNNNLGNLLHLDDNDYEDDMDEHVTFKLSEYYDMDNLSTYTTRNQNSINIMSFNAQSIWAKLDNLKLQLEIFDRLNHTIHIISVQEAWINDTRHTNLLNIENYTPHILPNQISGNKGGIIVYVHNSLTATEVNFFEKSSKNLWEGLTLSIKSDLLPNTITVHTVYRPPREKSGLGSIEHAIENHTDFMTEFKPYIDKMKPNKTDTIILGDFNYNLLETSSNSKVQEFFDLLTSNEFIPKITAPTKINRESCNLYDHIYTKVSPNLILDSGVFMTSLSDHLPTFLSISTINHKITKQKYKTIKDFSDTNMKKVMTKLEDLMQKKIKLAYQKTPAPI